MVTHLANVRYLSGFSGTAGVVIVAASESIFFTDGRYREQAREEVRGARIRIRPGKSALAAAAEWLGKRSYRVVGIEAAHLTVAERSLLGAALGRGRKLVAAPPILDELRMVKDSGEIPLIRSSCRLGDELFRRLLQVLRPKVRESEVAGEIEFAARKAGADQMAFPTIIAGGARSALPHGRASLASIPGKGFVVSDFGVILAGYCSDMTRTVFVGTPTAEDRDVYEAVRIAQQASINAVKPGASADEVDRAGRNVLKKKGLGKYFTHSTGHGVGLEIHEAPRIAAGQKQVLLPGMVITIEPGAYIPGKGGVRIEDMVMVTERGCEILTPTPKDLITI